MLQKETKSSQQENPLLSKRKKKLPNKKENYTLFGVNIYIFFYKFCIFNGYTHYYSCWLHLFQYK